MARRLRIFVSGLLLLLSLWVLGLWIASYRSYGLYFDREIGRLQMQGGRLRVYIPFRLLATITPARMVNGRLMPSGAPDVAVPPHSIPGIWPFMNELPCVTGDSKSFPCPGIEIDKEMVFTRGGTKQAPFLWNVFISCWLLFAVTAMVPAVGGVRWIGRRIQRRRLMAGGRCPDCGYDLRAHQKGERCPECGAANPHGA